MANTTPKTDDRIGSTTKKLNTLMAAKLNATDQVAIDRASRE